MSPCPLSTQLTHSYKFINNIHYTHRVRSTQNCGIYIIFLVKQNLQNEVTLIIIPYRDEATTSSGFISN